MHDRVCLIVPCFNEARRLDLDRFAAAAASASADVRFVFVDDGSTDGTADLIERRVSDRMTVVRLDRNGGKAEAVRQGMLRAAALPHYAELDWIGFWDADLSTPLEELPRFLQFPAFCGVDVDAVIGSRVMRLGSRVRRRALRHVFGRAFATASSLLLHVQAYDSQCGAKIFRPAAAARAFADPFVTRWIFDLEVLIRLGIAPVLEYPVMTWTDVGGSKFHLLPNVWRTARDLVRLRLAYRR
jgi:dolichyl-phosphate beta-glucosyltransferase